MLAPVYITATPLFDDVCPPEEETVYVTKSPASYQDVLERISGSTVTQLGGDGAPSFLSVRGGAAHHVAVIQDGMLADDPSSPNGAVNLVTLAPIAMDTVTLTKDASSMAHQGYGSAVQNVFTRPLDNGASIEHAYGRHHSSDTRVSFTQVGARFALKGRAIHHRTSGFVIAPLPCRRQESQSQRDASKLNGYSWRIDGDASDRTTFTWITHGSFGKDAYNDVRFEEGKGYGQFQRVQHLLSMSHKRDLSSSLSYAGEGKAGVLGTRRHDSSFQKENAFQCLRKGQRAMVESTQRLTKTYGAHVLSGAINGGLSKDAICNKIPHRQSYRRQRVYINVLPSFEGMWPKSLTKARRLYKNFSVHTLTVKGGWGLAHQRFTTQKSVHISGQCRLYNGLGVHGSAGKTAHVPTLFHDQHNATLNAAPLHPEKIRSITWGASYTWKAWSISRTYFLQRVHHMITSAPTGCTWIYVNQSQARLSGSESKLKFKRARVEVYACHIFLRAYDSMEKRLLRRPAHTWKIGASYDAKQVCVDAHITIKGKRVDLHPTTFDEKVYASTCATRLSVTYKPQTGVEIFTRLENICAKAQEDPAGYLMPGCGMFVGFRLLF